MSKSTVHLRVEKADRRSHKTLYKGTTELRNRATAELRDRRSQPLENGKTSIRAGRQEGSTLKYSETSECLIPELKGETQTPRRGCSDTVQ